MNFFQKLNAVWQKVGLVQRALLIAIFLAFIGIGVLLVNWARRPDLRMLYQQLSPEEASKITEKINEKGTAVMIATHNYELPKLVPGRIIKMEDGNLVSSDY